MAIIGEQETTDIISTNSYFGTLLLGTIPIIGDIMLQKWSVSNDVRINKRHLCSAYLKLKLVLLYPILVILIALIICLISGH